MPSVSFVSGISSKPEGSGNGTRAFRVPGGPGKVRGRTAQFSIPPSDECRPMNTYHFVYSFTVLYLYVYIYTYNMHKLNAEY